MLYKVERNAAILVGCNARHFATGEVGVAMGCDAPDVGMVATKIHASLLLCLQTRASSGII